MERVEYSGKLFRKQRQIKKNAYSLFCWFTSQVNSYGHGGTVSSPYHIFFLGKLEQAVNQYFVYILSLVTTIFSRREENDQNYFIINLQESMGPSPGSNSHLLPDMLPTALHSPAYMY